MSKKKATKRKSGAAVRSTDGLCAVCLGTGKYQREHTSPSHWHLEKFSNTHYSIIGHVRTLNDGESREEVMGVAEYNEAVRIRDNHNEAMDAMLHIATRSSWNQLLRDLKDFGESCRRGRKAHNDEVGHE